MPRLIPSRSKALRTVREHHPRCGWGQLVLAKSIRTVLTDRRMTGLGRVGMWRGGGRFSLSVSAPFVWRCLNSQTVTPFPHPAHRTGHADLPHPALGQDFTPSLSRVTPSAASERSSELIGCPISRSLTASCVCLELRSLPSTGVTRLQRYYEPLRHPRAPGLSLAGVRLIIPDHAMGLPVLRALSSCTCCRHYPGAAAGGTTSLILPVVSAFPERVVGSACASSFSRLARRSLALRPAHSRCHRIS
jgi:hypothetical protein